jgi:hypothetical protein
VGYLIHPRVTSIVTEWLTQTGSGSSHTSIL